MPSPFPGMNPYLEREGVWHGFHDRLCVRCADILVPQVQPGYVVDIDEHVYIHELGGYERRLVGRPDNYVTESGPQASRASVGRATITAPIYTRVPAIDEERLSFVKILDQENEEVVTVIEFLSPVNKASGRADYLTKRADSLKAGVGIVEIDLLRGGQRLPLEQQPDCDYCVMVVRPTESPKIGVWPVHLREKLPEVPVPLRIGDSDAKLDVQDLLNQTYDAGGYVNRIYRREPEPALSSDDLAWAKEIVPRVAEAGQ